MIITNFHYPQIQLKPPGPFMEYPKWVTPPGRKAIIVHDAEEEARVMAVPEAPLTPPKIGEGLQHDPVEAPIRADAEPRVSSDDLPEPSIPSDERGLLIAEAATRGVKIDKRWATDKIRAAVETAASA